MPLGEKLRQLEAVDWIYRQFLEDDAGMRTITPEETLIERLKKSYDESIIKEWLQWRDNQYRE
jgi:hypothetical protein